MKKLISLFIFIVLLSTIITGCAKTPSQKEIDAARLTAISYASTAFEAVLEEEWFDDYTLIGVYIGGYDYAACKEPIKEYTSALSVDGTTTGTVDNIREADWDFIFFLKNQKNEIANCDVFLMGGYTATSTETGEIVMNSQRDVKVSEPHIADGSDQSWFDEYYAEVRRKGYKVYAEDDVCFFIEANEIM